MSTALADPPIRIEKDAKGFTKLVYDAVLPHPSGQKVTQTFTHVVGNPDADPMQYYNDPFGLSVYRLLLAHEEQTKELAALKSQVASLEKKLASKKG